jgi:hypothetical protein
MAYVSKLENTTLTAIQLTKRHNLVYVKGKGKGKAIPLQPLTGPEGSRRLRFPDFKTIGI